MDYKNTPQDKINNTLSMLSLKPTVIIESGGGKHLYWLFKEPYSRDEIDRCEAIMRGICMRLEGDTNATDASRILRIPNTLNHKYRPPRPVKIEYCNGSRYVLSDFEDFIAEPKSHSMFSKPRSTVSLNAIMECKFMQHCQDSSSLTEPQWYAMMTILAREPGGPALIHAISKKDAKRYKPTQTDKKIIHALNDTGPMTCEAIKLRCDFDCGLHCKVKSPAALPFIVTKETKETKETNVTSGDYGRLEETNLRLERNVAQEVKDWLETCDGTFSLNDISREFGAKSQAPLYNIIKNILWKLNKENTIERVGAIRGVYRKTEKNLETVNWWEAPSDEYPISLPLGLGNLCKIMPKSIIVVAGEQNSAKSAFALNLAMQNSDTFRTHYFNSEMSAEELRERIFKFDDTDQPKFRKVCFYYRIDNFHDVIFPNDLNIIDFLEIHEDYWRIGGIFRSIYDRLEQGVALVNIQKAPGKDWGRGGTMSIEKARLYLAVSTLFDPHGQPYSQAKIVKAKLYRNNERNPNGMVRDFRVYGGAKIMPLGDWQHPRRTNA